MRKIDGTELLLAALMVWFSLLLVFCAYVLPNDGSLFTGILTVISGCSGGLLLKIKTGAPDSDPVPPGTTKSTVTVEKQATPAAAEHPA